MTPGLPASPPDLSSILTSLGVFSLAIAAVVGGIYKGIKEVKKGGTETGEVKSAVIVETLTIRALTDSHLQLVAIQTEIRDLLRQSVRQTESVIEAIQDHRAIIRSQIEEQHRLRAATVDLVEIMRRRT